MIVDVRYSTLYRESLIEYNEGRLNDSIDRPWLGGTGNKTVTWWRQIHVGGISLQAAIHTWWTAGAGAAKTVRRLQLRGRPRSVYTLGDAPGRLPGPRAPQVHRDCLWADGGRGNGTAPAWPGTGTPPANPDGRMPWCVASLA